MDATAGEPLALGARRATLIFLAFAFAYFFSALLRAITATLAPVFSSELELGAAHLGLLAGAYFLGFAVMQLPVGRLLDRFGPKRVLTGLLLVAVVGCVMFAAARTFNQLLAARLVIGVGVSACMMAPLTLFRHRFDAAAQLRASSWMLMTGSLGMLASTLPVQWLLPLTGWRGLFAIAAALLLVATALIAWVVPAQTPTPPQRASVETGYLAIFRTAAFRRLAPAAFFSYGGMIAMQSLWIGPWLTEVGGHTPSEAATGLFIVNGCMLLAFLGWGVIMPRLTRAGWSAERLVARGWVLGAATMTWIVWRGAAAGAADWAVWCVTTSVISLSLPAMAQAVPASMAGRALSAFNLAIFFGVFVVQWGFGLMIDAMLRFGWKPDAAYRAAFAIYLLACVAAFISMHWQRRDAAAQ